MAFVESQRVEAVKVFESGAEIFREVVIQLPEIGLHTVEVPLPHSYIVDDAVNVLSDDLVTHQVKVDYRRTTAMEFAARYPGVETLLDQLNSHKHQWQQLSAKLTLGRARLTSLQQYLVLPEPRVALNTDVVGMLRELVQPESIEKVVKLLEQQEEELLRLVEDRVKIKQEMKKIIEKIREICGCYLHDLLERIETSDFEIQEIREKLRKNTIDERVVVNLTGNFTATRVCVNLVYAAFVANWRPSYEVVMRSGNEKELDFKYYASIEQSAGEAWENIELNMCSGMLGAMIHCPELNRRGVTLMEKSAAHPGGAKQNLYGGSGAFSHAHGQTVFKIPGRHTITANESERKYALAVATIPMQLQYISIPEKADAVYRLTELSNILGVTLLAGEAVVLHDSSIVSKAPIPRVTAGDRFKMYLGEEQKLQINMKPVSKQTKQLGNVLVGQGVKDSYSRDFVVRNAYPEQKILLIVLSMPISESDQIKVTSDHPPNAFRKCPTGIYDDFEAVTALKDVLLPTDQVTWCWNEATGHCIAFCNIGAQSNVILRHAFSVEYPKSLPIEIATK
eukprot:Protomagalhaensia_sp_Gyna_25__958@NODE_1463_length_1814_cov_23_739155_g1185_i0_p1_GENE_NODE_1463_length_1814_cov_23_739155_g1185_i0NODE_1463_length_1814_cov_23_739155_g1185_i0_p1_ORF_typecomplete_len565_score90_24DUF4139/PF13598_6/4_1e40DUF4140/PF13600_6/0_013DUF4140/PF13600_6/5_8e03DUF4140/PF13600_6/3_9e03eIF3m_C_helix/PF18005_1/0_039DUF3583/PF12126_8/0_1DUF812/PF05667_11/0_088APG17/PF04108_12/0_12DUF4020/PF13212_6/0_19DUF5475/PF17569_2/0_6Taxilin/PF09728_9/0_44DUF4279/PF14106_6/4_7DUF4279/PF14